MTLTARRGVAIAAGLSAAGLAAALITTSTAGAAGGVRAGGGPRAAAPHAGANEIVTNVIDQISRRIGLVGIGAGPNGLTGRARLVITTNFGRTFTDIGPRTAKLTEPDSIFFLDREHGWFATFSVLTLRETLYRTSNGGRTWQSFSAPMHNVAAGAGDVLQFVSPTKGFLIDNEPTAPAGTLYRTGDGGATWHRVAVTRPGRSGGPGVLPSDGQFEFEPGGRVGWLTNTVFGSRLYQTADGGRTWHPAGLRAPSGAIIALPAIFGSTLIDPVTTGAGGRESLRLFASKNGGATWAPLSSLPDAARPSCSDAPMPTSLPGPSVWWAAAFRHHRAVAYRTADAGVRWSTIFTPAAVANGLCGPSRIAAPAASRAWLLTRGPGNSDETLIYATTDAGRTWQRIDLAALAAG